MKLATAFIEIRVDNRAAKESARESAKEMAQEATKTLAQFFSAAVVVNEFRKVIGAASRLEQAVGGSAAVFGRYQRQIDDAAKTSAKAMGLSEAAFRELTSQIGGLLQGLGFTQEEAAKTSISMAQLGADLAATFGGRPEDAVAALGAALRGEFDPLERFGVSLNVTQANLKAVEMGLASSTSQVDLNARAQASLAIIMERSALAQGQYGREQDTAAGKAATFSAELENLRAELGEQLLPMFVTAVGLISGLAGAFGDLPGPIQVAIASLVALVVLAGPMATLAATVKAVGLAIVGANPYLLAAGAAAAIMMGAIAALTRRHETLNDRLAKSAERIEEVRQQMEQFDSAASFLASKFGEVAAESDTMRRVLAESGLTIAGLAEAAASSYSDWSRMIDQFMEAGQSMGYSRQELRELRGELGVIRSEVSQASDVQAELAEVTDDVGMSTADARKALEDYAKEQQNLRDEVLKTMRGLFDFEEALLGVEDAYAAFIAKQAEANAIQADGTKTAEEKAEAARRLRQAELGVADSALQAAAAYARQQGAADGSLRSAQLQAEQLIRLAARYPELRDEIGAYINKLAEIPNAVPTNIQALIDAGDYAAAERALNELARNRQSFINVSTVTGGQIMRPGMPNVRSAQGRYVDRFMVSSLGEEGPEAVLPLTKPSRLARLLEDQRIRQPVVEALGASGGSSAAPSVSVGTINTMSPAFVREELEMMLWRIGG